MKSERKSMGKAGRKKYLLILSAAILLFISSIVIHYLHNSHLAKRNTITNLRTIALFKAEELSHYYEDQEANVTFLTTSPFSQDIYSRYIKESSLKAKDQIEKRNRLIENLYGFEKVISLDVKGKWIIKTDSERIEIPEIALKSIDSAIRLKKIHITNFYLTHNQEPQNALIAPVVDNRKEVLAVMVFFINPNKYLLTIKETLPLPYETAKFSLASPLNKDIMLLTFSKQSLSRPVEVSKISSSDLKLAIKENKSYEDQSLIGNPTITVVAPVAGLPWHILNTIEKKELIKEAIYRTLTFAIILFFVLAGFMISVYFLMLEHKARRELMLKTTEHENFFNNTIDLLCIADSNGVFRQLNPEWEKTLGYGLQELIGQPFIKYVHPDDVEQTINATRQLANNYKIDSFVNRYRHKNGSYRWIEWRSFPFKNSIYATARDITERIKMEDELQKNIDRARIFADATYEGILISDQGIMVEANQQFVKMLGYDSFSELEGKQILQELIPPEAIDITQKHIQENISEPYETKSYRKDKTVFPVEVRGRSIIFNGKPMRVTTIRDLTGQKEAEQELRDTNFWLKESQRNSHIGSYNYDIVNDHWISSEELNVIFGITDNYEKSSKGWINIIHPLHQSEMTEHLLNHVIANRNPFNKQYRIVRQNDGEERWVHGLGHLTFGKDGNPIQMIGTIQDITEQKNTQEEILIKEQRFRSIFENSSLGIALVGLNGKYLMVNSALCEIMGYTEEEMQQLTLFQITHPDDIDLSDNLMERLIKEKETVISQTKRYIHKEGKTIWAEISSRLIYNADNIPLYFITHINDITERKIAEDLKKENEEKFRIAFNNSPTGMSMIRADGHYVAVNPMLCDMFGYTAEELLSGTINKITHPDDIERSHEWIRKKISGDDSEPEFEKRFIHKDGHVVWGLLRSQWIKNQDGSPRLSVTHILDITERKKVEEALRQSEQKYRLLFENMTSGFALHQIVEDENGTPVDLRFLEVNSVFEKNYAVKNEDIKGKGLRETFPNMPDTFVKEIDKVLRGETDHFVSYIEEFEKYIEFIWFKPDKTRIATIFNDITTRVKAEEELKASEERFLLAFKTSPDSINITRLSDGRYIEVNEGFLAITGYSAEEVLGRRSSEINIWVDPEDRQRLVQGLAANNKVTNLEARFRKKNGEVIVGLMSAALIKLQGEKCILNITRDISDRKRAEQEIIKLNTDLEKRVMERTAQLERANKDLEAFAYSVSHDLRAPLRHLDGFARLMFSKIENPDPTVADYFKKINDSSKRMAGMIDDLLTFSRLGRKELNFSTIDLKVLVKEIREQFKPDTIGRNIIWDIKDLPTLSADKNLLKLALENLISNAIKYTSKKAETLIEIGCTDLSANPIEIYIKDNGVGFDNTYQNKLFNVFQRLHTNEEFEGTGIGLANVKQIVQKHNGSVRAEGKIDEGAVFYIILPK
jgi:PAS domain S-box